MYILKNKVMVFLSILFLGLWVLSCKTENVTGTKKSQTAINTSDTTDTYTDSDDASTNTISGDYTVETYDSDHLGVVGVYTCKGLYKLGQGCDNNWSKEYKDCYVNTFTKRDDAYSKKVADYLVQGYTSPNCYTSGSGKATSLIKYDASGAHQVIIFD